MNDQEPPPIAKPYGETPKLTPPTDQSKYNVASLAVYFLVTVTSFALTAVTFGAALLVIVPIGLFLVVAGDHKRLKCIGAWMLSPLILVPVALIVMFIQSLIEGR